MSHPKWSEVYSEAETLPGFINHIYTHNIFLNAIFTEKVDKLLETGVGGGSMSIFLSYFGLKITAIDNDDEVIKVAKQNNEILKGRIEVIKADAFKLPFPDNSFDLVFHQGFFEHFSDDEISKLLTEQLRVSPSVVFSVPSKYYLSKSLGERLMSKEQWESILKNFNVVESNYYGRPRSDTFIKRCFNMIGWKSIYYYAKVKR